MARPRGLGTLAFALAAIAVAAGPAGGTAPPCARCHETPVALAALDGGHAALACESCHRERRPGRFTRRHRAVARCAACHDEGGHPARTGDGARATRRCLACHEAHGSSNRRLVRPALLLRGPRRLVPIRFEHEAGAAAGGFTDPAVPGAGLCEVCHRHTEVYRADGGGAAHFTEPCVLCHDHGAGFAPVIEERSCAVCHAAEAERHARPSLHRDRLACGDCHAEVDAAPGPGHRATPACADCHADRATHAPPGHAPFACTACHDAHGTDNRWLVLDVLPLTQGGARPVRLDNLLGRAEGSFAGDAAPGTGVCEVCHTSTRYYRADGGEPHFSFSCLPCHLHAAGFRPR